MDEIRREINKALPSLSDNDLNLLLIQLDHLGVEEPRDMQFVQEADLASVFKVIQCRKLLNHFKALLDNSHSWGTTPEMRSRPAQNQQSYYQMNSQNKNAQPDFVSPCKHERSTPPGLSVSRHRFNGVQSDLKSHPSPSGSQIPTITIPEFTLSSVFSIPNTSPSMEHDTEEYEVTPVLDHNTIQPPTQNPPIMANSYAPYAANNDSMQSTGSFSGFSNVPNSTSSRNVKPESVLPTTSSTPANHAENSESFKNDYYIPDKVKDCNTLENSDDHQSQEPGGIFSNYVLPIQRLSTEIQTSLKNNEELDQYDSRDLVRVITAHMLEKLPNPSLEDMACVASRCTQAYPKSLSCVMSGRNTKPGYESLLNKICNRFKFMKQSTSFSDRFYERQEEARARRPGRPRGNKRGRFSVHTGKLNSASPTVHSTSSDSTFKNCRSLSQKLSQGIQECLRTSKPLNDASKRQLVQAVFDNLLSQSSSPSQEYLQQIARTLAAIYPGSIQAVEILKRLSEEAETRAARVQLSDANSQSATERTWVVNLHPISDRNVASTNSAFDDNGISNSAHPVQKTQISSAHWKLLRNYKIPFDKLPERIQNLLRNQLVIDGHLREQLLNIIIQDFLLIIPQINRDELKSLAMRVSNAYPYSLKRSSKTKRENYIGYLKKFMEIAVKITHNESLGFYLKKRNTIHNDDIDDCSTSDTQQTISENEIVYYQSVKQDLKIRFSNEEWNSSIADSMSTTYPLRKHEIEEGYEMSSLKDGWPFLFHEKGFLQHLRLLLGICLKTKMEQNFRDKWNILRNYFLNQPSKTDVIARIISEMTRIDNLNNHIRDVLLLIIDYFGESSVDLFHIHQSQRNEFKILSSEPRIIIFGDNLFTADTFSVYVQRTALVENVSFTTAFIIYFGSYVVFNLAYPSPLIHTLEFVQKCFAEIPFRAGAHVPMEISEKVDKLLKYSELQGSHKNSSESRL